jgi:Putative phage tail protein
MSGLFGGGSQPSTTPDYTGLQIQTAVSTLPIPIVWGLSKLAPNVIWYSNFQTYYGESGGKGGLFGGGGASTTTYSASLIMALCEGAIAGINQIWKGQSLYSLSGLGLSLFTGTVPQSSWSYVADAYPSQALGYEGTAYVCAANYSLGDTATLDNHNFEVKGLRYGTGYGQQRYNASDAAGGGGGYAFVDADPALIVADFLTNAQFGVGFPSASIDAASLYTSGSGSDAAYQSYCRAVGLALSPALIDQEQAASILARWLQLTNTAAVWSGGLLRLVPYGDSAVTGNGVTFAPNVTPIYDLGDDDFKLENDEDPLQVSRSDPYAAYNVWRLEAADRTNAYNLTSIESRDQNAIELYGMRIAPTVTAHEICDCNVAAISGQLMLQRAVYIRNTYKFRLSWEYSLLDPMDLVTVTDPLLGLAKAPVRITEIEEDGDGFLSVTAEEFPLGVATATLYPTQAVSNNPINRNVAAAPANAPVIFEPPPLLAGSLPQIWIAASGGSGGVADPNWGGCYVWLSLDGASYSQIGVIAAPARQGVLTASLAAFAGTNPDTADTLALDLAESGGALAGGSAADAASGTTLCIVESELLSFQTATLTSANEYSLATLYRGLYGTAIAPHTSGAPFARLDDAVFTYDLPAQYVGRTLYVKLQSFNVFGGGVESLADCTAYTYAPSGGAYDHPVAVAWTTATPMDLGSVAVAVGPKDDFGVPFTLTIEVDVDLGQA